MTNPEVEGLVERVARAIHPLLFATITDWQDTMCDWADVPESDKNAYRHAARAAIRATLTHPFPDGEGGEREKVIEECAAKLDEQAAGWAYQGRDEQKAGNHEDASLSFARADALEQAAKSLRSLTTSEPRT